MTARIRLLRQTSSDVGASAVEYALIVVAIAAVIVAVVYGLGRVTKEQFSTTCSAISSGQGVTGSC